MARVKKATNALKTRRNILRKTKGYYMGRSTKERQAKEAIYHAVRYSFQHRHKKKNDFRRLWNTRITAGLEQTGSSLSYSKFMKALKDAHVGLDRKVLADMAVNTPESFKRVVAKVEK